MTVLLTAPEVTIQPGPLGPFVGQPPGGTFGASVEMTRVNWPNNLSVPVQIDGTNDGGDTWYNIGATEITDSYTVGPKSPLAASLFKFSVRWPEFAGVPRVPDKVRVVANSNKAFTTAIAVSVF